MSRTIPPVKYAPGVTPGKRRYASVAAAAEHADVNSRTIRRWIADGLITGYRVGGKLVKVDLDEIDRNAIKVIPAAQASR
jgi:excisionase family DNA binding protein